MHSSSLFFLCPFHHDWFDMIRAGFSIGLQKMYSRWIHTYRDGRNWEKEHQMANETPSNKGEQVKGGPLIVENAHLPPMGTQAFLPSLIPGAVKQMSVGGMPAHGRNLTASVPTDSMPKPTSPAKELVGWKRPRRTMATPLLFMAWMAGMLLLLSACSSEATANPSPSNPSPSATTASPSPSPSVQVTSDACAVQGQTPPSANI